MKSYLSSRGAKKESSMYISTTSPAERRVDISALFELTFMRFSLMYLYISDCGSSGAAFAVNLSSR